ncbi:LacI family transcriptional regulator [Paenibacillus sp. FSL R5-0345]|uniref:LacI family DNA-binding transcriptional regulator n=1 Tax=Paenibacillus sp. FSL R5-0345 TaxID=1536770 RepID=UPI0004F701C9|nr:LacI family DNA-binding transcriptional regulator [Paenibacillus sp. FSL R5-0345]AIQ37626.1 LacI family transcriptional regulator [Paenibacillus sp. FSL R5-0345]
MNIHDVAKKSGLSVVTVSRVLNNLPSVREANRQKVLEAMEELNYQPNSAARSLVRGKTGVIGMSITNFNDSFYDRVIRVVNRKLAEQGYFLALSIAENEDEGVNFLFQKDRVDGIILLSPIEEKEYVDELKRKNIPFVLLDNQLQHEDVPSVVVDNYQGGYEATKHLIGLGHTQIAYIGGPSVFLSVAERKRGYVQALGEAGLTPFGTEYCGFTVSSGYEVAKRWIREDKLPTAIFSGDDFIALGVVQALREEGILVPQDISVVGFDDQQFVGEFYPRLTTVRQPEAQMGSIGVDLLMKLINGEVMPAVVTKLAPQLLVRESTASVRLT